MMSEPRDRASLAWQAFCYVAGELSPAEHEAFEASLAEDQQAREAVAEAVELVHVIAAAESQLAQPAVAAVCSARLWRSRIGWVLVGGVASLLFAWLSLGPLETNWRGQRSGLDRPRELAAAWVQTRRALATTGESEGWLPGADLAFDGEDGLWLHEWQGEELMEDEIAETPSWMVAAVVHAGDLAGESGAANPSRVPTRAEN